MATKTADGRIDKMLFESPWVNSIELAHEDILYMIQARKAEKEGFQVVDRATWDNRITDIWREVEEPFKNEGSNTSPTV